MVDLLISEWIKLRTVRSHLVLLIVAIAFPVVLTGLIVGLSDVGDISDDMLAGSITGSGVLSALLAGVVGVLAFAQESTYNTLRVTFAATPIRRRVIVAKAIVVAATAALMAIAIIGITTVVGSVILGARDAESDAYLSAYAAFIAFTLLCALLGLALGMLTRSAPVGIVILIAWPFIVEGLLGGLLGLIIEEPFQYLPFLSAINALSPTVTAEGFGRVGSLAYFGGWVLVLAILGAVANERRDV